MIQVSRHAAKKQECMQQYLCLNPLVELKIEKSTLVQNIQVAIFGFIFVQDVFHSLVPQGIYGI